MNEEERDRRERERERERGERDGRVWRDIIYTLDDIIASGLVVVCECEGFARGADDFERSPPGGSGKEG